MQTEVHALKRESSAGLDWARLALPLAAALLVAGCAYAITYCSVTPDLSGHAIGTDDAFISYRYAKNWVDGHGLVYNPGDYVEGYSNLTYVLLMGLPFALGVDVFKFSVAVNIAFALGAMLLLHAKLRARAGESVAAAGALLFSLFPSIWIWVASGMETPLILLLQLAVWVLVERVEASTTRANLLGLCAVIALLTVSRADGFVTGVLAAAYLGLKGQYRALAFATGAVATSFALITLWRLGYYGDFFPNTYYAKVTSSPLARLKSSIRELGGITGRQGYAIYLVTIAYFAVVAASKLRAGLHEAVRSLSFSLMFPLCWIAYWLYVGGDTFEDRFLIVLAPIGIYLLLTELMPQLAPTARGFLFAACAVMQLCVPVRLEQFAKELVPKYDFRIAAGKFMSTLPRLKVLATPAAGKVPFYSGLRTIDMHGLSERHIGRLKASPGRFVPGHAKWDVDYVFSLKPDFVFSGLWGDGFDISGDMPQTRYEQLGYRVRYLVNTSRYSVGQDVLDADELSPCELRVRARGNWRAVILERTSAAL